MTKCLVFISALLVLAFTLTLEETVFIELQGGLSDLYYTAKVNVGTPASQRLVVVDTASDMLAFPCDSCPNCGPHANKKFLTDKSSTFGLQLNCPRKDTRGGHPVCIFSRVFAEGSALSGFLGSDYLRFKTAIPDPTSLVGKSSLAIKAEFGCSTFEEGKIKDQPADGIVGLNNHSSFLKSLEEDSGLHVSVGLCLAEQGGAMLIGPQLKLKQSDQFSIDFDRKESSYISSLKGFSVASGENIDSQINVVFDSGTTFNHFPPTQLAELLKEINIFCKAEEGRCAAAEKELEEGNCWTLSLPDPVFASEKELIASFPTIHLSFDSQSVFELRPKNYLYLSKKDSDTANRKVCLGLYTTRNHDFAVLGTLALIDHFTVFDRQENKIKGYEADCSLLPSTYQPGIGQGRMLLEVPKQLKTKEAFVAFSIFVVIFIFILKCQKSSRKRNRFSLEQNLEEVDEVDDERPRSTSI